MSPQSESQPPLSEPEIIAPVFVDGIEVAAADEGVVRLIAWTDAPGERRLAARLVITGSTARRLAARLRETFGLQH